MKPKIEVIGNESGDWEVLLLDGQVIGEGHSLNINDWQALLIHAFDTYVRVKEISDKNMEEGNYAN